MSTLKRRDRWCLLSLAAVAPIALPAQAQQLIAHSPAGAAQTHLAGHSRTAQEQETPPGVTLELDAIYDSNIAERRAGIGPLVQPEDEIFKPAVRLNLRKALGRETAFLSGYGGYDFYRQNTFLNRERVDLDGGLRAPIGRCNGTLSGAYGRHQSSLEELASIIKNTEDLETVSLQEDCTRKVGLGPLATVSQGWTQNSDPTRKPVDHRVLRAEGGMAYSPSSLGQVLLFGNYEDATYPNAPVNLAGIVRDNGYQAYAGGIRLTHKLGARIEGEASLSYQVLDPNFPMAKGFSGLTYSVDLGYRPSRRLWARIIASRENTPSNRLGSAFSTNDTASAAITYKIGAKLRLVLGGEYKRRAYGSLTQATDLTRETAWAGDGTFIYDLTRRLALALKVEEEKRDANVTAFSFTATRVGLRADARF